MIEEKEKKNKIVKIRMTENLSNIVQQKAQFASMSLSGYVNFLLSTLFKKDKVLFSETTNKSEKKDIESRIFFTINEADILKVYAASNGWSLTKEIRYRVISSLSKKPKLNEQELKAIYAVRSSINILGANVNRLVREHESLSDHNIQVCQELVTLIKELKDKISYLEKCSSSNFKLKKMDDINGCSS